MTALENLISQSFQPAVIRAEKCGDKSSPQAEEMQIVTFGCQVNVHHRVRAKEDMDRC